MLTKTKIWLVVSATVLLTVFSPIAYLWTDIDSSAGFNEDSWWVYVFHLYYDNGQLFADRDFEFKYDLIAEPFVPQTLDTANAFWGEIVSINNETRATFQFNPELVKGKISVKGPYFADAAKVNFYNSQNQLLLILDVSGSSVCNDDGICNSDVGESIQNCPSDCREPSPSPSPTVTPSGFFGLGLPGWVLILAAVVLAAIVIWIIWVIIKRKKAEASSGFPPADIPPSQPLS